ncbi:unnamed protein product [Rhizophagus irregularis]|nr:unnamed protein product [Rhizophagus irregularis]
MRNEKELPGLRNGCLRREGTSWTSKWTLETRSKRLRREGTSWTLKWTLETRSKELPGLQNGRLRQEGMLPEVFYIKMFIIIPFFCRNAV